MATTHRFVFLLILTMTSWTSLLGQRIEYEFSLGPQTTKARINDYMVGIVGSDEPMNDRLMIGYTFNATARTKAAMFQPGLQLKTDMVRYNVYLPLFFPEDYMSKKQSRWDNIYTAYRLGLGANLRINFNTVFIQPGFSYLFEVARETTHQIYSASDDNTEDIDGEAYTSGAGVAGELQVGIKLGKGSVKKFGLATGIQYLFVEQSYTDDQFLHHWEVTPVDFFVLFSYRLTGTE
jgi:hypothetical protein